MYAYSFRNGSEFCLSGYLMQNSRIKKDLRKEPIKRALCEDLFSRSGKSSRRVSRVLPESSDLADQYHRAGVCRQPDGKSLPHEFCAGHGDIDATVRIGKTVFGRNAWKKPAPLSGSKNSHAFHSSSETFHSVSR